jgi:sugar phosphate isomerase/epimerase
MPVNLVAVNIGSYRQYREGAFAHLEAIGVRNVEIPVPAPDEVAAVQQRLLDHGLTATTLNCPCDLTLEPESLREKLEAGKAMGVSTFFVSAKAGELSKVEAYARLRARCELADEYGINLSLETHPDLAENATEARATLLAVAHPRLRWNLDTANLYYYNRNLSAVSETRKGLDLIGSVHLKDTNGGYHAWWFPALGEGVVDFPGVFQLLTGAGFFGPFTLELEGIEGEELDEAAVQARVARSIRYLDTIGVL